MKKLIYFIPIMLAGLVIAQSIAPAEVLSKNGRIVVLHVQYLENFQINEKVSISPEGIQKRNLSLNLLILRGKIISISEEEKTITIDTGAIGKLQHLSKGEKVGIYTQ